MGKYYIRKKMPRKGVFMKLIIFEDLGWGFSKLAVVVDAAIRHLGLGNNFEIIGNPKLFPQYGVKSSPALSINGEIVIEGYVPSLEQTKKLLVKYLT